MTIGTRLYPFSALKNSGTKRSHSADGRLMNSPSVSFKENDEILGLRMLNVPEYDSQYEEEIPPPPPDDEFPQAEYYRSCPRKTRDTSLYSRTNSNYANRRAKSFSVDSKSSLCERETSDASLLLYPPEPIDVDVVLIHPTTSIATPKRVPPVIPRHEFSDKELISLREKTSNVTSKTASANERERQLRNLILKTNSPAKVISRQATSPEPRVAKKSAVRNSRLRFSLSCKFGQSNLVTSSGVKKMNSVPLTDALATIDASDMEFESSIKVSDFFYTIGDIVEIRRSNGVWVEGIVLHIDLAAHGILVEYASDGALYQKKLKFNSPLLASCGTHLTQFKIGEIVECLDKDGSQWSEAEVVGISAKKVTVRYNREDRSFQKQFVAGSVALRKKEETLTVAG